MAYDRHDPRNAPRDERSRWSGGRDDGQRGRDNERGFLERAGDEIASWFGSEDEHRPGESHGRERGGGPPDRESGRDWNRGRMSGSGRDERDRDRQSPPRDRDPSSGFRSRDWERGEGRGYSASTNDYNPSGRSELWGAPDRGPDRNRDRDRDRDRDREQHGSRGYGNQGERDYRPMTGDYGRSEQYFAASGGGRGGMAESGHDYDRSQSEWGQDQYRQTSRAGTSDRSDRSRHERPDPQDPHYSSWRQRHMSDLDRDYEDYRREHQSKFESDFGSWRERRQQKRGALGQVREHMDVVGNDDKHVGTVDKVAGDRLILTKSDPESGGAQYSLSCSEIDRIEADRVILDCSAEEAKTRWRDESRGRALFERDDQGEAGPRALDRSFGGTYR